MNTVHPYPTLRGRLDVRVRGAAVDGEPLPYSAVSQQQRILSLGQAGLHDWREGVVDIEASPSPAEIAEGPWTSVRCVVVLAEEATRTRVVRRLEPGEDGRWYGEVPVLRSLHLRRAVLTVSVIGSYGGVDGLIIGGSAEPWSVDLLADSPTRHPAVEVLPTDFRDGGDERLRPFRDAPWFVDTAGETPKVLLNTSFEGVTGLLSAPRGPLEKALAGVVASQIAGEAWVVMFHCALSDVRIDEDGTPRLPSGWKEAVLNAMLPDVLPGRPLTDAATELHRCRTGGPGWAELQSRIHFAASRRAAVSKNLVNAIRAVLRAQEGVTR